MFSLVDRLLRAIRYRRRWGDLATAANAAADAATAELDRHTQSRRRRPTSDRPPSVRLRPRVPSPSEG